MSGPGRLRHRVGQVVADQALWAPGQRVAVAVSGGLDSTVLLDLLCATRAWHGGTLSVITIDHGTREGSAEDADSVQRLAKRLDVPCTRRDLGMGAGASEGALREARYRVFDALDVDVVALAHHRRDQAETLLLAMLRGSGTLGLGAMAPKRGRFVRPLLDEAPSALLAWAVERDLVWREDPSNDDPRFLRNAVRHRLLPLLEELRGGAIEALARSARHAASDARLLDRLAQESDVEELLIGGLLEQPEPLARRQLLSRLPNARASHIDAVLAAARRGSGRVRLSDGVEVIIDRGRVVVHREHS